MLPAQPIPVAPNASPALTPRSLHPTSEIPHPTSINPQSLLTPEDKARFREWFDYDRRLAEVADACQTNVVDLAIWAAQPHITAILDHVRHIASQRSQTLHAEAKHASIARLFAIVRGEPNNEVARRAADRLLRPNIAQVLDQDQHPLDEPRPNPHANPHANPNAGPSKLLARHNTGRRAYQLVATRSQVVLSSDGPSDPPRAPLSQQSSQTHAPESPVSLNVQTANSAQAQEPQPLPATANSAAGNASQAPEPAPLAPTPGVDSDEDLDLDLNDPSIPQSTIRNRQSAMATASPRAP